MCTTNCNHNCNQKIETLKELVENLEFLNEISQTMIMTLKGLNKQLKKDNEQLEKENEQLNEQLKEENEQLEKELGID